MPDTISIPNWDSRFETAQSRKVENVTWTPFRHNFAVTLQSQEPEVAYAIVRIVLLAATLPNRGTFNDGCRDLTPDDIARCVGASGALVAKALSALGAGYERAIDRGEGGEGGEVSGSKDPSSKSAAPIGDLVEWWNEISGSRLRAPKQRTSAEYRNLRNFWQECGRNPDLAKASMRRAHGRYTSMNGSDFNLWNMIRPSRRGQYILADESADQDWIDKWAQE